jgi:hypothetical protein
LAQNKEGGGKMKENGGNFLLGECLALISSFDLLFLCSL